MRPPLVDGVFGCLLTYAPWRTLRDPVLWPSCAIMRENPRIFFAHTLRHMLVEDVQFNSVERGSKYFFARMWKRTSWRAHRYAGCSWGRHGVYWNAIWVNKCAEKKRALFNHPCGSYDFFVVKACIPVHKCVWKSKNCELENKRRLVCDYFGHGESESGPYST
jgi:hypothetical protein